MTEIGTTSKSTLRIAALSGIAAIAVGAGIATIGSASAAGTEFDWKSARLTQKTAIGDCGPGTYTFVGGVDDTGKTELAIEKTRGNPSSHDFDGNKVSETLLKLTCTNKETTQQTEGIVTAVGSDTNQATQVAAVTLNRTSPMAEKHISEFAIKKSSVDGGQTFTTVVGVEYGDGGGATYSWDTKKKQFVSFGG